MKKEIKKLKKSRKINTKNKNLQAGIIFIILILAAVFIGAKTSFYGVAMGILIGFLLAPLINQIKNK